MQYPVTIKIKDGDSTTDKTFWLSDEKLSILTSMTEDISQFAQNVVLSQDTQPDHEYNKIWINTNESVEYTVPSYQQFEDAQKNVVKTVNGESPDENGNVNVEGGSGVSIESITTSYDSEPALPSHPQATQLMNFAINTSDQASITTTLFEVPTPGRIQIRGKNGDIPVLYFQEYGTFTTYDPDIALLDGYKNGLVPHINGPEDATRYLRGDGTWSDIDVPEKVSELNNDAGYITSNAVRQTYQPIIADLQSIRLGSTIGSYITQSNILTATIPESQNALNNEIIECDEITEDDDPIVTIDTSNMDAESYQTALSNMSKIMSISTGEGIINVTSIAPISSDIPICLKVSRRVKINSQDNLNNETLNILKQYSYIKNNVSQSIQSPEVQLPVGTYKIIALDLINQNQNRAILEITNYFQNSAYTTAYMSPCIQTLNINEQHIGVKFKIKAKDKKIAIGLYKYDEMISSKNIAPLILIDYDDISDE